MKYFLCLVLTVGLLFIVKAQDSVFSYAYQGTTLYYIIDNNQQARVVPPLYPNLHYNADSTQSDSWYGYSQPQGPVVVPDTVVLNGTHYPVTALEAYAFYRCYEVTSVTLPVTVTYLEHDAFWLATSLQSIFMPGVTWIGNDCFYQNFSLTSVTVPSGVTELIPWTFGLCTSLQSVILPDGLISIGQGAFYGCSDLQVVDFPNSLTTIGKAAFYECNSLQSVDFPNSLTTIGTHAFLGCSSLQSIDIPSSVSVIDEWCFSRCSNLATVTLHEGTETIGFCAFRECTSLTTINYPSTLTVIGDFSFQYDSLLAIPLIFPENLTYLGVVAYGDCISIVTASLPGTLGSVPDEVFYGCLSLSTVTLGEGITSIGEQAFNHCPNIDTLFVMSAVPPTVGPLTDSTFFTYNSTVVVPCGSRDAYISDPAWSDFAEIIEDCNVGIPEVDSYDVTIRVKNCRIEVEGAEGETVRVFDITGRLVHNESLSAGVYLVQVGKRPAQKVLVHPNN